MTSVVSDQKRVSVGIGQLAISRDPKEILVSYGLGSCIGVSVYDPGARVAGLVHVLLPAAEGKAADAREPARFADTGIDTLMRKMTEAGAIPRRLIVKIAGGASVLGPSNAERFKIGERNADAVKEQLKKYGVSPTALDLGGTKGRTIELHPATGKTFVRTAASPAVEL